MEYRYQIVYLTSFPASRPRVSHYNPHKSEHWALSTWGMIYGLVASDDFVGLIFALEG